MPTLINFIIKYAYTYEFYRAAAESRSAVGGVDFKHK